MPAFRRSSVFIMIAAAVALGCDSNGSTQPTQFDLSGTWTGTADVPETAAAKATVQQRGTALTGEMSISTRFPAGQSLSGSVDASSRTVLWSLANGCEQWSGSFTISSDAHGMDGSLLIERSGCPPDQAAMGSSTGTLSLSR
jgi:hypothetical protein